MRLWGLLPEARRTPGVDVRRGLYARARQGFAEENAFTLTGHPGILATEDPLARWHRIGLDR